MVSPVGTDFFRMESEHGIAVGGIAGTDVKDGVACLQVNGRQENLRAASLLGSLYNGIAVGRKLFTV